MRINTFKKKAHALVSDLGFTVNESTVSIYETLKTVIVHMDDNNHFSIKEDDLNIAFIKALKILKAYKTKAVHPVD